MTALDEIWIEAVHRSDFVKCLSGHGRKGCVSFSPGTSVQHMYPETRNEDRTAKLLRKKETIYDYAQEHQQHLVPCP